MTLFTYKVIIYDEETPTEHKGIVLAKDFKQAMSYLGETYEPDMGEVYLVAVDDTTVLELSPKEYERVSREGAFYDGYYNI